MGFQIYSQQNDASNSRQKTHGVMLGDFYWENHAMHKLSLIFVKAVKPSYNHLYSKQTLKLWIRSLDSPITYSTENE